MTSARDHDPYTRGLALSAANRHAEAIACYEEALAAQPHDIRVLFALGNTASALGLAGPAEAFFRQVLALEPDRLEALVNLANLLRARGHFDAAEALLAPAIARNPNSAELELALGSVCRERGDCARAISHYRAALQLKPQYPAALGNLGDCLADEGKIAEAYALYERALGLDPGNAQLRLNRAVLHLLNGNLAKGWDDYEARLAVKGKAPHGDHGLPRWNGECLANKRLLITAEQGVGDQLMFASLIPELAALAERQRGQVILECEARLAPLLARSFRSVRVRGSRIENHGGNLVAKHDWLKAEGGADIAIPLGSLARVLRMNLTDFPNPHRYLLADARETNSWCKALRAAGNGLLIGICWRSGKTAGSRSSQYAPLDAWADFLRTLPGAIVCGQYDARDDEVSELERKSGRKIFLPEHLDQKNELDRTCAMLSALDCVVSAPTAVSWLASGAGIPTYKLLYDTSWTSFARDYEPFAPACALVMPDRRGNWTDVFGKATRLISKRIGRS